MKATARRSVGAALLAPVAPVPLMALTALMALIPLDAAAVPLARPVAGRHAAHLCVATLPKAPSCGQARVDVRADGTLRLRVDDIVYNLQLHRSQAEVVVMHNAVQIDEFTAPYEWVGATLRFEDDNRHARYEVRFDDRPR